MARDDGLLLADLDPEQAEVVTAEQGPVGVIAGPGAGKTTVITRRIAYGVLTDQVDPRRTLAVTYTTRAAAELRSRLRALGVGGVQARTIHSAALRQISHFWPQAFRAPLPPVSDARTAMLAEAAGGLGLDPTPRLLRDVLDEIHWAKVSNVPPGDYPRLAEAFGRQVDGADPPIVAALFANYERVKTGRGVIDVDDILLCDAALLSGAPDVAAEVRAAYAHFVVDEYQDVSPIQHTLIGLWLGPRDDLCVVGDPNQSVHGYAGARPEYLLGFRTEYPDARLFNLVRNHRSTASIVAAADQVIRPINAGVHSRSTRGEGVSVLYREEPDAAAEAAAAVSWLEGLHARGTAWRDMAVLVRTAAQSRPVCERLRDRGVPYRSRVDLTRRSEVRRALDALERAATTATDAVTAAHEALAEAGWPAPPPSGDGPARDRWESLSALADEVENVIAEHPGISPAGLAGLLRERILGDDLHPEGVSVSTMHAAKGLEWDAVAVLGVHEGSVPHPRAVTERELAEERRLLHVAFTRARDRLWVSWSRAGSASSGGARMSRFLVGLDLSGESEAPGEAPAVAALCCRVCGRPVQAAAEHRLRRHLDCPAPVDQVLLKRLSTWRHAQAQRLGVAEFLVLTETATRALAELRPATLEDVRQLVGPGSVLGTHDLEELTDLTSRIAPPQ